MKTIKTVLFDLDGTLLPMDRDAFEKLYLGSFLEFFGDYVDPKILTKAFMETSHAMIHNKEKTKVNKDRFFEKFGEYMDKASFDALNIAMGTYYDTHFDVVKSVTSVSQAMIDAVAYFKEKGYDVILATNPLFPRVATDKRIAWAGLKLDDFIDVTRFEENHFCKPQLEYFQEIIDDNDLDPTTCLMVGNDVEEDLIARHLGMKTALITDDLIYRNKDVAIECDWQGSRIEFLEKIKEVF